MQIGGGGILGYRRMREAPRTHHNEQLGTRRLRRMLQESSLWGVQPKTRRHQRSQTGDDLVADFIQRRFMSPQPNTIWDTDLNKICTAEGKLYLCMITDLYDGVLDTWQSGSPQSA